MVHRDRTTPAHPAMESEPLEVLIVGLVVMNTIMCASAAGLFDAADVWRNTVCARRASATVLSTLVLCYESFLGTKKRLVLLHRRTSAPKVSHRPRTCTFPNSV